MSEMNEEPLTSRNDNTIAYLRGKVYRRQTTLVALVLFIGGVVFIALGSLTSTETAFIFGERHIWQEVAHHVLRDLGIAATISALLGTAYEYLLRHDFVEHARAGFRGVLREREEDLHQLEHLRAAGLQTIHEELTYELLEQNFLRMIQKAQRMRRGSTKPPRIRILETWTALGIPGIMDLIKEAASKGCRVEILSLDPRSPLVAYRAHVMREPTTLVKGQIEGEFRELCRMTSELQQTGHPNLEAKVYDAIPTNHIYDFDGTMLIGVYWSKPRPTVGPQFEIVAPNERSNSPELVQAIDDQFQYLWQRSKMHAPEVLKELEKEKSQQEQAHVLKVQLKPGNISRRVRNWRELLIPKLREQKGFEEALVLGDYSTNEGLTITLWKSENDLQAATSNAEIEEAFTLAADVLAAQPEESSYDVLLRERKHL